MHSHEQKSEIKALIKFVKREPTRERENNKTKRKSASRCAPTGTNEVAGNDMGDRMSYGSGNECNIDTNISKQMLFGTFDPRKRANSLHFSIADFFKTALAHPFAVPGPLKFPFRHGVDDDVARVVQLSGTRNRRYVKLQNSSESKLKIQ